MRKITFNKVGKIAFNHELNTTVFSINGYDLVLCGGEFTASGVRTFLRPLEKVLENKEDIENYSKNRRDVVYYIDNKEFIESYFENYNK